MGFSFENIVNEEINKVFGGTLNEDVWMQKARQAVNDRFNDYYNQSEFDNDDAKSQHDQFVNHVNNAGKMNGININPADTPKIGNNKVTYNQEIEPGSGKYSETFNQLLTRVAKKLIEKADELSQEMTKNGGIMARTMYAHNTDMYGSKQPNAENVDRAAELMRYRDLMDSLSLSFLYDKENQGDLVTDEPKFGIVYKTLAEKDGIEKVVGIIADKFNLQPTVKDIIDWASQGTRYGKESGKKKFRPDSYGGRFGSKENWTDENGNLKFDELKQDYLKSMVAKILNNVYGITLDMPGGKDGGVYSQGNAKLPTDTLIINFTSAHRCPAWNECLVKYACYARTSEHGYKDLFAKNKRLNVMWEGSRYDDQLMSTMKNLIRCSCVSITNITNLLNRVIVKQGRKSYRKSDTPYKPEDIYERLSTEGFKAFQENELSALLNEKESFLRVKDIRLNEEGDFIGQWLLDAFDEFAGELRILGIQTAAYTCRHLNFDGVKNIIINASLPDIGGVDGQEANAIARRFYAVSAEEYNSFGETYAAQIDENGNPIGNPVAPTYIENRKVFGDDYGHVVAYPQPLYIDGKPTGQLYYKCPCGRGKHGEKDLGGEMGKAFDNINFNGTKRLSTVKSKGKNSDTAVDCYDCRMCYQPKLQGYSKPIIVLVQVHSENAEKFDADQAQARKELHGQDFGKSADYAERNAWVQQDRKNVKDQKMQETPKKSRKKVKESVIRRIFSLNENFQNGENDGLKQIAQNGINSVQQHMSKLGANINEQKDTFMNFFNRINKELF